MLHVFLIVHVIGHLLLRRMELNNTANILALLNVVGVLDGVSLGVILRLLLLCLSIIAGVCLVVSLVVVLSSVVRLTLSKLRSTHH